MKRFYFNMIEIIIAISILAIGISSVMVLFTSGLKANKGALSSNALPDIAESAIAQIRTYAFLYATGESWGAYIGNMPTSYETAVTFAVSNSSDFLSPNSTKYSFLYRQLSPDENGVLQPTFTALIRVKKRTANLLIVDPVTGAKLADEGIKNIVTEHLNNSFAELEMEISYPADAPEAARDKKYYRIELYNDKYNRIGES